MVPESIIHPQPLKLIFKNLYEIKILISPRCPLWVCDALRVLGRDPHPQGHFKWEKKKKKEEIKGFIGLECSLGIRRVLIGMLISGVYL